MATNTRERAIKRNENRDKRPRAVARFIRISSRKMKIVIDLIRGRSVAEAQAILSNTPNSGSFIAEKLLNSAIANAENNLELDRQSLYVAECYANQGPSLKRIIPKARGRANRILKRTSHITIVLDTTK